MRKICTFYLVKSCYLLLLFSIVLFINLGCNGNGNNSTGPEQTLPQSDINPPSAPTNLQGSNDFRDHVTLNWTESTDNVGVTGYRIKRDGAFRGESGRTTFTDFQAPAWIPLKYTVTALDSSGNESPESEPFYITIILDIDKVTGKWASSLTPTDSIEIGNWTLLFRINKDSTVTGAISDIHLSVPDPVNADSLTSHSSPLEAELNGKWAGESMTISVGTDSIPGKAILESGTITLHFDSWGVATGHFQFTGKVKPEGFDWIQTTTSGDCVCIRG